MQSASGSMACGPGAIVAALPQGKWHFFKIIAAHDVAFKQGIVFESSMLKSGTVPVAKLPIPLFLCRHQLRDVSDRIGIVIATAVARQEDDRVSIKMSGTKSCGCIVMEIAKTIILTQGIYCFVEMNIYIFQPN